MIILTLIVIINGFVSFWEFDAKQKKDAWNRENEEDSERGNVGKPQRELRTTGEKTAGKSLNDNAAEAPKWLIVLNYLTFSAGILMVTANLFIQ